MKVATALDRKLVRETSRLKGQIVTIALVLAAGIMSFIALRGATRSLDEARDSYYDRCLFAHVFARVNRAPESVAHEIETLPGVAAVQTRVAEEVALPLEGMPRAAWARILSLPSSGSPATNAVMIVRGRLPQRGSADEVALLAAFAEHHGLEPGHRIPAVVDGKLRSLRIVGIVVSPEFVYAIRPGAIVDDPSRYAVLWMDRATLSSAFQLDGAFNEVSLRLQPGASDVAVRAALDRILKPYGGDPAVERAHQISNRILRDELGQLASIAGLVPFVFLAVAAFLINMVLARLLTLQRTDIAMLKAIGYTNAEIARHYLGVVVVVMIPGVAGGVAGGRWLGGVVLDIYGGIFRFPELTFHLSTDLVALSIVSAVVAATTGALVAIRSVVVLPPAEAMRPPAPARYRRGLLDRLRLARFVGPTGMMILREVGRRPLYTALSAFGIGSAMALVVLGNFAMDSIDHHFDDVVQREQRQDLAISFARPLPPRAISEAAHLPGVTHAEGARAIPVRIRFEHRTRDTVLHGIPDDAMLRRLLERGRTIPVAIPRDGVLLTRVLADVLGFRIGDRIEVELLEGDRRVVRPIVAGFVDEAVGIPIYADAEYVASLGRGKGAVSAVLVTVDGARRTAIEERLRRSPNVIDVGDLREDIRRLRTMHSAAMNVWRATSIVLAVLVIFGVVYNNARISLATRSRDLASLRVLGMYRGEVSAILIGGLAIEVLLAVPVGLFFGRLWSQAFMSAMDEESYRWTVFVSPQTYGIATTVALVSAAASALWVRRSVDRLDLIGVLKTRE